MARPGEIRYVQKADDDWDGRRQKTLVCRDAVLQQMIYDFMATKSLMTYNSIQSLKITYFV